MFTSPKHDSSTKPVELLATLALALSTLVAVTAVSIGIVRADGLRVDSKPSPFISRFTDPAAERANSNETCSKPAS